MKFKAIRSERDADGHRSSRMVELTVDDLSPGEVLIRSRFAPVNYKDARAVTGVGSVLTRFPCVPGIEVSGQVVTSSDTRFREGEWVTVQGGREFGISRDGGFSEYVRAQAHEVFPVGASLDPFSVVALGIAAYTSAVAVEALERHGVGPDDGEILVTGATGGCSSFAISMLAGLGYPVVGMTGKASEHDYLAQIGALRVIGRDAPAEHGRALDEQLWSGCIDAVGGIPLDFALRTMKKGGIVAAFGNAGGGEFTTSIYPFILRGVTLAGVNANHPVGQRGSAWARLADDLRPAALERIAYRIGFDELQGHCEALIAGRARGRAVVVFD